jgi:hypothetical protein
MKEALPLAYVSIRQHTSAYVSIRQRTCVGSVADEGGFAILASRRQTDAHCCRREKKRKKNLKKKVRAHTAPGATRTQVLAYTTYYRYWHIRHTTGTSIYDIYDILQVLAYTTYIRRHEDAGTSIYEQHTSAYVSIRQHTSAYVIHTAPRGRRH